MRTRYDVLIVGGGLLGCALARQLVLDGVDVVLVERDQINQHASGRNAGSLHFQLEFRMVERGLEAARRAAEAMPLHLDAAVLWRSLQAEFGDAVGVEQQGGLMLAQDTEGARLLEAKADIERSWGLDVQVLSRREVRELAPYLADDVVAAAYCPLEGKANARTAAPAICRASIEAGATVLTRARVRELAKSGGVWRAAVQRGPGGRVGHQFLEADAVVLAAGVWTNQLAALLGARLPIGPLALTMAVTARTRPLVPHLIQHAAARLSLKQTDDGNLLIGGGWPARLADRAGGGPDLERRPDLVRTSLAGNARAAVAAVPAVADLPVLRTWIGTTTIAPDQLPVIGPIAGAPGAFVATGGSAFTLGPSIARSVSELVQGRAPRLDLTPYGADRFTGREQLAKSTDHHA